jgi:hypothetical protein
MVAATPLATLVGSKDVHAAYPGARLACPMPLVSFVPQAPLRSRKKEHMVVHRSPPTQDPWEQTHRGRRPRRPSQRTRNTPPLLSPPPDSVPGAVLGGPGGGGFATFGGRPRRVVAKGGWRLQGAMAALRVVLDPGQLSPCALAEGND